MTREEAIEVIEQDIPCEYDKDLIEALDMAIKALKQEKFETVTEFADRCRECGAKYGKLLKQEPCPDAISRQAVEDKLLKLCNELEGIFADIRMEEVDDCVCGLCEYDCDHGIDGSAFECPGFETDECFKLADEIRHEWQSIKDLPPVNPQPKTGYISIDDVMSVFDDFMRGEADEDGTDTFLKMLKDRAESEGEQNV